MSSAITRLGLRCELLKAFLMAYDERVSQELACVLVSSHKCKWCRTSFADLARRSQHPVFMEDSRGVVHDLCQSCANTLWETDSGAKEIDLSELEDDGMRRIIFGIMVGELRHTQFKGAPKAQIPSSIQQSEGSSNGQQVRKSGFVRQHPARRGMAVVGGKH